jgi:hypothetical protein
MLMRSKFALIGLILITLMLSSSTGIAQTQNATASFTDGLSVGDTLVYKVEVDDSFNADVAGDISSEDGKEYSAELTTDIPDEVDATYDEFFGPSIEYESAGEFTTTFPNGTVATEDTSEYIVPTKVTLDNGTVFEGADAIAMSVGLGAFGTVSESDGIVTVAVAFILTFRFKYDVETGILQEMVLEDPDGEGQAKISLSDGDSGPLGLPAYDLPVIVALTGAAIAVVFIRSKKLKQY